MNVLAANAVRQAVLETGPVDSAADAERTYRHWWLSRDEEGVAWLVFDKADASTNVLSYAVLEELDRVLEELESDLPDGLIIRSGKPSGFCFGADVNEFRGVEDRNAIQDALQRGHAILDRLASFDAPTVAVIHGQCLGGGLELALACRRRIAVTGARLGFPEIKLGLHPGLGGTFRLTELIDPIEAMTAMLTGKDIHAPKAKRLGLVDAVVEERHAKRAAFAALDGDLPQQGGGVKRWIFGAGPARRLAAAKMRRTSEEKAPSENYPAPYALIDLWSKHGGDPAEMQQAEKRSFADLLTTNTAQNLIRVFFLRQTLSGLPKSQSEVKHVHVIGAGAMGGDIAAWCALHGLSVSISDVETEPVAQAVKGAGKLCMMKHKDRIETRATLDRLIPDLDNAGVARADVVIEAVPEKLELKHQIYESVEPRMKKDAVLATNTSSIPLDELAQILERPERFVGLHFFNPVSHMMVVEVIRHSKTADSAMDTALAFTDRIKKLPVPVESAPGFLVNRALTPYLLEAMTMVEEGMAKESVDAAAERFGFPMGPIELADQVGLDVCADVMEMLQKSLDNPLADIPLWVRDTVDEGHFGKKTGKGLYVWKDGEAQKRGGVEKLDDRDVDRLILPMLNACVECYRKRVVNDLDVIDGAMIFATGFAPFRGGPIHYAKQRGVDDIVERLDALAERHGERFEPDRGWEELR